MTTDARDQKITYTTMGVEQAESFNRAYDSALDSVMSQLGSTHPIYIGGNAGTPGDETFEDRSPGDTRLLLGRFPACGRQDAAAAVAAAKQAYPVWSRMPYSERVAILRRAADNFRSRKYDISAWLTLEAGKPRLEAMGEVEEAADLITTYCDQMEEHGGFRIEMGRLSAGEMNYSVLRPYGVWLVISPFNFPVALLTGMLAGVLVAGNTAVFKPSEDTPMTGLEVYRCLADAGLPPGAVNVVTGVGSEIGEALSSNPDVDGIVFTGSKAVGTHVFREFTRERPRPCILEMGGKNPTIVTRHADLQKAVEGTVRAAFGYSGQKCSATSRLYVEEPVWHEFRDRLVERTQELLVGNPTRRDVFTGPVIYARAYDRFKDVCRNASSDGEILTGGNVIADGDSRFGYYCEPTIARLPAQHRYFFEELFVPFVAATTVTSLDEALRLANDSEYGLTAGIFTENREEIDAFLDRIEAGVVYVNRRAGSTTGAWPGIQPFGGWKASGSTGKSALGFYYIQQFMREQGQTVVDK